MGFMLMLYVTVLIYNIIWYTGIVHLGCEVIA